MRKIKSYQSFFITDKMGIDSTGQDPHTIEDSDLESQIFSTPSRWRSRNKGIKISNQKLEKKIRYITLEDDAEVSKVQGSFASALSLESSPRHNPAYDFDDLSFSITENKKYSQLKVKTFRSTDMESRDDNVFTYDSVGTASTKLCNSQSSGSFLSISASETQNEASTLENNDNVESYNSSDEIVGIITASSYTHLSNFHREDRHLKFIAATPSEEARMHTLLNKDPFPDTASDAKSKWWKDEDQRTKEKEGKDQGTLGMIVMDIIDSILDGCQTLGLCTDEEEKFRIGGEININPDEQSCVIDDITFDQSFVKQRRWRADT